MKYFFSILFFILTLASCTSDNLRGELNTSEIDDSQAVEVSLNLGINALGSPCVETRSEVPMTDEERVGTAAERMVSDIWVFQYGIDGALLITPRYYDIPDVAPTATEAAEVNVLLRSGIESTIYVVANTRDENWADASNAATISDLQALPLENPGFIKLDVNETSDNLHIPMEGNIAGVIPGAENITVPLTRMYAKMEIYLDDIPETIDIRSAEVNNIPHYCRVEKLGGPENTDVTAPALGSDDWVTYSFNPGNKNPDNTYDKKMTLYLPENLRGRTGISEANPELKSDNAPENALRIIFHAVYTNPTTTVAEGRRYVFYPGANNYNDYNICRNYIYRTRLSIHTDTFNLDVPSSNCYVAVPGQIISFLPYYRTETGGGYDFTYYLDAYGTDKKKIIDRVGIIWQTKDAIGDNTDGDLVWIDDAPAAGLSEEDRGNAEFHRKIYVKTQSRGNALIAAYNSSGEIIWSWHIWVTDADPANVGNAVVYTTYAWNETGIRSDIRVPGYAVMPCNLGALKFEPTSVNTLDPDTHGMLYQWGRKDPFPPGVKLANSTTYSSDIINPHYANDNTTPVEAANTTDESVLFHSIAGNDFATVAPEGNLKYSIQNPTVFICGTKAVNDSEAYSNAAGNYHNNGDWLTAGESDDCLWGGLAPDMSGSMKYYTIDNTGSGVHIFDNYSNQKSIFDPCPSGWRVPPGDLWLGFSSTGINPEYYREINTSTPERGTWSAGMYMYMTAWKSGPQSFFPIQGTRVPNGMIIRIGTCGNYHNATTDLNGRVNIIHIHRNAWYFHIFETSYRMYYTKSTGGPVRCVRDTK